MQSIYAHPGVHLALGRKGENVARQVVFNLRLWRAAYGDGAVSLCAMRAGDAEPYPCGVTQDEDTAVWVLRAADVDKPGWGNVQLSYYVGDTLAKSQTWRTLVAPSLCACGDPGEVQQGWLDQAGKDAAAAQQGAKDAQEAQRAAEGAAKAAKGSAEAAASAAKAAQDATEHPPRINEETQTWLIWQDGEYRDTGLPIAASNKAFTFTITPVDGQASPNLSATRTEMLAALDAGKALLGYWTETRTVAQTTIVTKHEFRLESVSGTGADRGLAFVNYEQFYKSTLYVNGNDTVSFVDKEQLPNPMTKTEAMTQSVGMDDDGRLWTEPGASGDDKFFDVTFTYNDKTQQILSDKTYQQVREAIVAGNKIVRGVFNTGGFVSTSYRDTNNSVVFSQYIPESTRSAASSVGFAEITMNSDNSVSYNDDVSVNIYAPYILGKRGFFMESSTALSTKMFKITVDDNGTLTATEVTDTTT